MIRMSRAGANRPQANAHSLAGTLYSPTDVCFIRIARTELV